LRYYRSTIVAPQSKDINVSHGRRSELPSFVMRPTKATEYLLPPILDDQ